MCVRVLVCVCRYLIRVMLIDNSNKKSVYRILFKTIFSMYYLTMSACQDLNISIVCYSIPWRIFPTVTPMGCCLPSFSRRIDKDSMFFVSTRIYKIVLTEHSLCRCPRKEGKHISPSLTSIISSIPSSA